MVFVELLSNYYKMYIKKQHGNSMSVKSLLRTFCKESFIHSISCNFQCILFVQFSAHARLMLRKQVTVQDAVVAVSLMESSMQGGALLGGVNALHTSFPEDPETEYRTQGMCKPP